MTKNGTLWALAGVLIFTLVIAGSALAQDAPPGGPTDDEVNAIAKQLYCPVCENIPLDVCPTQACAQWRALIREKLAAGWTEAQIKGYFVEQYGDRVLASPPARGLNWLVYLLPPGFIVAGALILIWVLRAYKAITPSSAAQIDQAQTPPDEYAARLEEELRRR